MDICCKGLTDRKGSGAGFVINKTLTRSRKEFFSINERVAGIVIKLSKRYTLEKLQTYAPTSTYEDQ